MHEKEKTKINRCTQSRFSPGMEEADMNWNKKRAVNESLKRDAWGGLSGDLSWGRGWRLYGLFDKLYHFVSWREPAACLCAGGSNWTVICWKTWPSERLAMGFDVKVQLLFTRNHKDFGSHRLRRNDWPTDSGPFLLCFRKRQFFFSRMFHWCFHSDISYIHTYIYFFASLLFSFDVWDWF